MKHAGELGAIVLSFPVEQPPPNQHGEDADRGIAPCHSDCEM